MNVFFFLSALHVYFNYPSWWWMEAAHLVLRTTGHQNIFNTFKYFCLWSKVQWCINYLLWTYFNIFNSSYYSGHILRFIPIKMSGELRCLARGDAVTSRLVELDKIFITITIWAGWAGLGWAGLAGLGDNRGARGEHKYGPGSEQHPATSHSSPHRASSIGNYQDSNITFGAHINANKSIKLFHPQVMEG